MIWQDRYDVIYTITIKIAVVLILSKCRIMPVDNISSISKTLNDMPRETGFFLDAAFKIMPLKKSVRYCETGFTYLVCDGMLTHAHSVYAFSC